MLASPMLSPASSTRSLPPRLPEATSSRHHLKLQPKPSLRARFGAIHVYMGFMMSIIGAGMLSVPYTLVLVPMWQALAGIAFVGSAMSCTANALLHAHVHAAARAEFEAHALGAGSKFVGFQALARRAGGPALGYAVSLIMASGVYGGCVGNIQIIRDLTPFVVELVYGGVSELSGSGQEHVKQIVMWALLAVVLLPLCMLRKLSALQPTNYVSFVLSLYLVGAVVYRALEGYKPTIEAQVLSTEANSSLVHGSIDGDKYFSSGSVGVQVISAATDDAVADTSPLDGNSFTRLAQSISIYNFAFMMTLNLLPLFVQLLKTNGGSNLPRRGAMRNFTFVTAPPLLATRSLMKKCIFGATLVCAVLYGAIGCAAFDLYGDDIDGNILLNLEGDPVMKIPLVATYLTVLFTFPLLFLPLRSLVEELLDQTFAVKHSDDVENGRYSDGDKHDDDGRGSTRLVVVLALLCSQQIIALNVSGIEVVFSLMGATSCLVICYVFPVIAFTTVYPWRRARHGLLWVSILWAIVAIVSVQGATCVWLLLTS